jgi:hypothetical protein
MSSCLHNIIHLNAGYRIKSAHEFFSLNLLQLVISGPQRQRIIWLNGLLNVRYLTWSEL